MQYQIKNFNFNFKIIIFGIFVGFFITFLLSYVQQSNIHINSIFYLILYFIGVLFAIRLSKGNLFSVPILFLATYTFYLGIGGFIQYFILPTIVIKDKIAFLILIGFYSFLIGVFLASKNKENEIMLNKKIFKKNIDKKLIIICMGIIFFFTILAVIFYIKAGGIPLFFENVQAGRVAALSGKGIFLVAILFMQIPVLFIFVNALISQSKQIMKLFYFLIIYNSFLLISLAYRTFFIIFILNILFILNHIKKKISIKQLIIILFFLIFFGIFIGLYRQIASSSMSIYNVNEFFSRTYVNINSLNLILNTFPQKIPLQYGQTYLLSLKSLMPDYYYSLGTWLKKLYGLTFEGGGITPTIIGESFVNFGLKGIFIILFLLGFFLQKIYTIMLKDIYLKLNFNRIVICGSILIFCSFSVANGLANKIYLILVSIFIYFFIEFIGTNNFFYNRFLKRNE